jgi:hypothetical protein
MSSFRGMNQNAAIEAIVSRAAIDFDFRRQLLDDPRRAIKDALGIEIPTDVTIKFIEKDVSVDALVVLPDFRGTQQDEGELSDDDLQSVAGGVGDDYSWAEEEEDDEE